jgi:hypothetical protein
MVSPSDVVLIPVVLKSGAAVALADPIDSGSGAITTMVAMRAATSEREARFLNI